MDACCRHKTVPGTERHECVLGSLYWVGYMPWTIYFGFKKDLRAFILKFGVVLFKWEREGTLVLCCYHNKPPHIKAAQRTQIYLPLLKFCRSSRACQHRSEVLTCFSPGWHQGFSRAGFPSWGSCSFGLLVEYPFLQLWAWDLHTLAGCLTAAPSF